MTRVMLCDFLEKIDERRRGAVKQYFLKERFSSGVGRYRLFNGKRAIVVVILRHFSDNGRQEDGSGKADRAVG
jgi:hypothetical protein